MSVNVDENVQRQVREIFQHMEKTVTIKLFIDKEKCLTCHETKAILEMLKELAPKDKIEIIEFLKEDNPPEIEEYSVKYYPSTFIEGEAKGKVLFTGIPSGYEFGTIVEGILDISNGKVSLKKENLEKIAKIDRPMNIKVFVTPTCPYCPVAVRVAHKIAMANPNVVGEMVEATEFSALSQKFNVMGVPKTVIDDGKVTFEGGVPEDMFISKVMEAFNKN